MEENNITKKEAVFLAVLVFIAVAARVFMLPLQPSLRESYADSSAAFMLAGGQLYSEAMPVIDITPLAAYSYQAAYILFGEDFASGRLLGLLAAVCSMLAFYMAAKQQLKPFFAGAGLIVYGILINTPFAGGAYAEGGLLAQLPMILALAFVLKPEEGYENVSFAIAGALSAAAFFFCYHASVASAVPLCLALFNSPDKKQALQRSSSFFVSAFIFMAAGLAHIILNGLWKGFFGSVIMSLKGTQVLIFAPYAALAAAFAAEYIYAKRRGKDEENKQG